jgi:hypothetical protein
MLTSTVWKRKKKSSQVYYVDESGVNICDRNCSAGMTVHEFCGRNCIAAHHRSLVAEAFVNC